MTTTERPHLWTEVWKALDSNNPGDVCPALLDTYADLACAAVRGIYGDGGEVDHLRAKLAAVAEHRDELGREAGWNSAVAAELQLECNKLRAELEKAHLVVGEMKLRELGIVPPAREPNPWFTKPAEFPVEAAERADRERPSIGYAFRPQEDRDERVIYTATTPDSVVGQALMRLRDRRPDTEIVFGGQARHRLLSGEWTEAEVSGDDERTVRVPGAPLAPGCELHFRGGCANCGGTAPSEQDVIACEATHVRGIECDQCGWWVV